MQDDTNLETKGQPSHKNILKALEKSGYLFENKIAQKIQQLGFHVESSWAFKDPEEESSREIDIRAQKEMFRHESEKTQIIVELLVECKSSDSPMIFLMADKNEREINYANPIEYIFPFAKYREAIDANSYREISGFRKFSLAKYHYYYGTKKKATQFAKIVRKGSEWTANHDGIYDSLILPQAKAIQSRIKEVKTSYTAGHWTAIRLFFNVIVLRDHLFSLDVTEENSVPKEEGRVSFVRHIRSGSLDGYYLTDFVTESYLEKYILEIEIFAKNINNMFYSSSYKFLKVDG